MRSRRVNRRPAGGALINREFGSFTAFVNDASTGQDHPARQGGPGAAP